MKKLKAPYMALQSHAYIAAAFRKPDRVHIRQRKEQRPQHVVISQMFFLRQQSKSIRPSKSTRPKKRQDHRPWQEPLQIVFTENGKKPKGNDEHDSKSRAQTRLCVTVNIWEVSAQMKKGRNKEDNAYRPCEAGNHYPQMGNYCLSLQ